ncbi:MAG: DUF881 domain-containing protein [Clostridia bacterium]|nr:DUF881 domain-containing protein [Clostridia bacterium]
MKWQPKWQVPLTIVLFIFGIMMSVQFKTQRDYLNTLEYRKTEDLVSMWKILSDKRDRLRGEVAQLETTYAELSQEMATGADTANALKQEIEKLQLVNGIFSAHGPGIEITIPENTSLIYLDIIDLINELWASGAEAIAINNERITLQTAVKETQIGKQTIITINGNRLDFPATVKAIGDPETLEKGLSLVGGIIDNLNTLYGLRPTVIKKDRVTLPPATKTPSWEYAQPTLPG